MEIEDIMMRNQELSMDNERLRRQLDEAIRERDQAREMCLKMKQDNKEGI